MKYLVKWTATVRGQGEVEADSPDEAEEIMARVVCESSPWQERRGADVHAFVEKGPGVTITPFERPERQDDR